jgi:transposase
MKEGNKMKKLQISDKEIMSIAIQQEISRSEEARYDHRLHGVLLVCRGLGCYKVAEIFGQHPTTIQRWIRSFEKDGFAGLADCVRPGRPKKLTEDQWEAMSQDLRKHPRELGYQQNLWDGKLLSYHLRQTYKVDLGTRQCQRLFRSLGFRLRKPRPLIAKADPDEQEAFKKTAKSGKKSRG